MPTEMFRGRDGGTGTGDLLLAVVAGLGISLSTYKVLLSAQVQTGLPGWPALLFVAGPLVSAAGILVAGRLQVYQPILFEIAKFALVGALNTALDLALFNFLMERTGIFRGSLFPLLKGASFLVALCNAFLWNRNWTFRSRKVVGRLPGVHQFFSYAVAAIGGLALNVTVASLVVNLIPVPAGWHAIQLADVGALAALAISATWNFLCLKFIVFRPTSRAEETPAKHRERL